MKILVSLFICSCTMLLLGHGAPAGAAPFNPVRLIGSNAIAALSLPPKKVFIKQPDFMYENATLTEDVKWRGYVLIKGYVVIAPQATLRLEPGTSVRFARAESGLRKPRLVVMGRIQSIGTADLPILFSSDAATSIKGDWGGILLLSTEKRNHFEQSMIEGAETGIEARFSNLTAKSIKIALSKTGLVLHDSVATIEAASFFASDTAIESADSEFELRESIVSNNRIGLSLARSSLVLSSTSVTDNDRYGIQTEEGRLRLNTCDISGNGVGGQIKGGEGQIFMTRFKRNKDVALHLVGARLKINRSLIAENIRDGLRVEDGRSTIWGSAFSDNGGFNMYNAGSEEANAVQNWWGETDENAIMSKIYDASRDSRSGVVRLFPWLNERPAILP